VDNVVAQGLPAGRGLDLGCGDGLLTMIVLEETGPREIVGVDPDPAETARARELGIYAAVHTCGGADVPEPDSSFDWVLSNSVLEHIEVIEPVLGEVARLLRPGGEFIFTVPGPGFHACLRGPVLPGSSREAYLQHLDERLAHRRYWGPAEWAPALASHDLRITNTVTYLDARSVRRWESISRMTAGVLYALGGRRARPIEIQRKLGMRRSGARMPLPLARSLATLFTAGLERPNGNGSPAYAAHLITAVKRPEAA
jgi:SAM-dependent methyltransferase